MWDAAVTYWCIGHTEARGIMDGRRGIMDGRYQEGAKASV